MRLNSTSNEIERELRANAEFMGLVANANPNLSVSLNVEEILFFLIKNIDGDFSVGISPFTLGEAIRRVQEVGNFAQNLITVANRT